MMVGELPPKSQTLLGSSLVKTTAQSTFNGFCRKPDKVPNGPRARWMQEHECYSSNVSSPAVSRIRALSVRGLPRAPAPTLPASPSHARALAPFSARVPGVQYHPPSGAGHGQKGEGAAGTGAARGAGGREAPAPL